MVGFCVYTEIYYGMLSVSNWFWFDEVDCSEAHAV